MTTSEIQTEDRILSAACSIFLLYGYHGTTLNQIAIDAGVHKSAIHYYFRSKERLYVKVVERVVDLLQIPSSGDGSDQDGFEGQRWFIITEMYNNKNLFEETLKELYPNDWVNIEREMKKWRYLNHQITIND